MSRPKAATCRICGGPKSITGVETRCPECDWHDCDGIALLYHDTRTCPECGHEW